MTLKINGIVFSVGDQVQIDSERIDETCFHRKHTWTEGIVQCIHSGHICVQLLGENPLRGGGCKGAWRITQDTHYFVQPLRAKETMPLLMNLRKITSI